MVRPIAGKLNGRFTVMEEIAGDFMLKALTELAGLDPEGYAGWLYKISKECTCGHTKLNDPVKSGLAMGKNVGHLVRLGLEDRKSVVEGKRVEVRVDHGGRRINKKKKNN